MEREVLSHNLCCSAATPLVSLLSSIGSARLDPALKNDGKMFKCSQVASGGCGSEQEEEEVGEGW